MGSEERLDDAGSWRRPAALGAAALGAILLVLAVPRLIAALIGLEARDVVWDVHGGQAVPAAVLSDAADHIEAAGRWAADGESAGDRGLLLLEAAKASPVPADGVRLRAEAEAATAEALALAPGQPSLWLRLAHLRHAHGDRQGALAAFRMSVMTGPFVPALMISRTTLGADLLPIMDAETRTLFKRQIRLTWVVAATFVQALSRQADTRQIVAEAMKELSAAEKARGKKIHAQEP